MSRHYISRDHSTLFILFHSNKVQFKQIIHFLYSCNQNRSVKYSAIDVYQSHSNVYTLCHDQRFIMYANHCLNSIQIDINHFQTITINLPLATYLKKELSIDEPKFENIHGLICRANRIIILSIIKILQPIFIT